MRAVLISLLLVWLALPGLAQTSGDTDDRGFIAGLLEDALGGPGRIVRIDGFSGALSSTARIDRITIADDAGVWLQLDTVAMEWNRAALLRGRIEIARLSAQSIDLPRLPAPGANAPPSPEANGFALPELPVSVEIEALQADRITLGAPLLGQEVALRLEASARLAEGAGDVALDARRIDERRGVFEVTGSYDNTTTELVLDLQLDEAADGIAARLLDLPGRPSVQLVVAGSGPLDAFAATLQLDTDSERRLEGRMLVEADGVDGADRRFDVDIGGDVTALFAPQYRPFFGPEVQLAARGARASDGALRLDTLALAAEAVQLQGSAALGADGWPERFDLAGQIGRADGGRVLLPLGGPETTLAGADLALRFDAREGSGWVGRIALQDLERDGLTIARLGLRGQGTIDANPGSLGAVTADLAIEGTGIGLPDPDLNAALGGALTGGVAIAYREGAPLEINDLRLQGPGYALTGAAQVSGLSDDFATTFDIALRSPDIRFLSALAGQDLGGAVQLEMMGSADAGGAFDVVLRGIAEDLATGIDAADAVLEGETSLDVALRRDAEGLTLDRAQLQSVAAHVRADGRLGSSDGTLNFALSLDDAARLAPGIRGAVAFDGQLTRTEETWRIKAGGSGPYRSTLEFQGRIAPAPILTYDLALPDIAPLVPGFSGPMRLQGRVKEVDGVTSTDTAVAGPAGMTATILGSLAPTLNVAVQGQAPLGLASPLIAPRSITGQLGFDLRVDEPGLAGVGGSLRLGNATLVLPEEGVTLRDVGGDVTLSGGTAQLALTARAPQGGGLRLSGPVGLGAGNPANLRIDLQDLVLEDPNLYRTSLAGQVRIDGPLSGRAAITGVIDVGPTVISVPSTTIGSLSAIPDIDHVGAPAAVQRSRQRAGLGAAANGNGGGAAFPLDLTIRAPARIFVRGRGLDAELGGQLRLTGTTADIISAGAFDLIRGRLDILSQRFTLDRGRVSMQGDFDPFLDFAATTRTAQGTASVLIDGRASAPQVRFEANPPVPQDEVVAQLLFGRDLSQLSAFQALQLANAVATLAGREGVGLLSGLRKGFALDDLDVQTDDQGNTGVRAGKYISDNIYTDVTVGQGEQTGVSINIDLTPRITARGEVQSTGETSLGLFYERDY